MPDKKEFKLEIPDGMELPQEVRLPEIKMTRAKIRKTLVGEDGLTYEVEEEIEVPVAEKE